MDPARSRASVRGRRRGGRRGRRGAARRRAPRATPLAGPAGRGPGRRGGAHRPARRRPGRPGARGARPAADPSTPGPPRVRDHHLPGTSPAPRDGSALEVARPAGAQLTAGQFASVAVGESLVRVLSFGYGVRRALSAENRNRIRFEMRREVKRSRTAAAPRPQGGQAAPPRRRASAAHVRGEARRMNRALLVRRRSGCRGLRDDQGPPCRGDTHPRRARRPAGGLSLGPGCSATRSGPGWPRRKTTLRGRLGAASWPTGPTRRGARPATPDPARPRQRRPERAPTDGHRGDPPPVPGALRGRRPTGWCPRPRCCSTTPTCCSSTPGWCRSSRTSSARRRRPAARGERPEVRAHPRHRGRRQDHPARHVLRDVRQLLLRRLLQGGGDRARLGPGHQVPGATAAGGSRRAGCGRASTSTTPRRSRCGRRSPGCPTSGSSGSARGRTTGPWACPGRAARARRSSTTAAPTTAPTGSSPPPRGWRCRPRSRTATWSSGTWSSCRTSSARSAARTTSTSPGRCRRRTSTPAWASSGSRSCCRARTTCTRST